MADTITLQPVRTQAGLSLSAASVERVAVAVLMLFLCGWHWRVTGALTATSALTLLLFVILCLAYGSVFRRLISPLFTSPARVAFQLFIGYFVFNSLLFLFALCSPLGMMLNLATLALLAITGLIICARRPAPVMGEDTPESVHRDAWASVAAVLLACLGATIWCGDAQAPLQVVNDNTVFQIWPDSFIHAREISVFANAHGIASVQDIKLAGGRAPIYHFASYLSPAAISSMSGASAMQVYASFQLPFGIVLTGLAAYCLMSKLFGCWPGVAATVAIVLVPDAFQQGFQNRYLSYNFMAQINLGLLYGIACAALAWMFMLDGCRRGKTGTVLLAYSFLGLCLFYKAHVFVANSYLLMIFPFLFFQPVRVQWRIVFGLLATLLFCLVISWSQSNPRVPVLRLDGSGIGRYIITLLGYYDAGWMKSVFTKIFLVEKHGFLIEALYAASMLMISTFGFWIAGLAITFIKGWRSIPKEFVLFPILVLGNYLIMTMGLAEDTRGVGTPDELINRPLVWAYFVVAAWSAAFGYRLFIGIDIPKGKAIAGVVGVLAVCVGATVFVAPNLQTLPHLPGHSNFIQSGSVPECLVKAADYLRRSSLPNSIVQDTEADPRFIFTALSERQLYVGNTTFGGGNPVHRQRLLELAKIRTIPHAHELNESFRKNGIEWFLAYPDSNLAWPKVVLNNPAFSCNGYRLFHFSHDASVPSRSALAMMTFSNKGY